MIQRQDATARLTEEPTTAEHLHNDKYKCADAAVCLLASMTMIAVAKDGEGKCVRNGLLTLW